MKTVLDTTHSRISFVPGVATTSSVSFSAYDSPFAINRLMAIVNQTRNTIIYAEGQTGLGYTNYNNATRRLTLEFDTSTHSPTDVLQVIYDTPATPVVPQEEYFDPVNKQRVSLPQSLIDTDFEYGVQNTKWETVFLINNRPTGFYEPNTPLESTTGGTITAMNVTAGSRTVTVLISNTTGLVVGALIYIQDALNNAGNGWFRIDSLTTNTNFTYTGDVNFTTTENIYETNRTLIYLGGWYTGSRIFVGPAAILPLEGGSATGTSTVTFTTPVPHNLVTGNIVTIGGTTATANPPNGTFSVTRISDTSFSVTPGTAVTGAIGVTNATLQPSHILAITAATGTTTITVTTEQAHGLAVGSIVIINGITAGTSNGTINGVQVVASILSSTQFTYAPTVAANGALAITGSSVQIRTGITNIYALNGGTATGTTTVTFTTPFSHNLVTGNTVIIVGSTTTSGTAPNGTFTATRISDTQFSITGAANAGTISLTNATIQTNTITVTTPYAHGLAVGNNVFVDNLASTTNPPNGSWLVLTVPSANTFTYLSISTPTGPINGSYGSNAQPSGISSASNSGATVTVNTASNHGLVAGNIVHISGITAATSNPPNGTFVVAATPTATQFTYAAFVTPVGALTTTSATIYSNNTIVLYTRPGGFVLHRPFDGGVTMSSGPGLPNSMLIRQTRKYFRYQSGKGLQFSTGSIFRPALQLNNITASSTSPGATITVTTKVPHGLVVGSQVTVSNSSDSALNGTFEVVSVLSEISFTYNSVSAPSSVQTQSSNVIVTPANISGALVRLGLFDTQNGIFFESDGSNLYACRRSSTLQITGLVNVTSANTDQLVSLATVPTASTTTVTVTTIRNHGLVVGSQFTIQGLTGSTANPNGTYRVASIPTTNTFTYTMLVAPGTITATTTSNSLYLQINSNVVTGVGTLFSQQLSPGDYVVIKGKSYRVNSIISDTSMMIYPEYRGNSASNTTISKTVDLRIPQSQWNIDKFDGTGPSGFNLDTGRMQMAYIDYSWYGAGFIRYGFRAANGNVTYAHKILNNNVNTEAYMRSGNLPARYEEGTMCPTTFLRASMTSTDATMTVNSTDNFPTRGVIRVISPGNFGVIEYMRYTGKTSTTFTGLTRGVAGGASGGAGVGVSFTYVSPPVGSTFTPTPVQVELVGPNGTSGFSTGPSAQTLSHWGSAIIMDGRFDNDQNFVFSAGQNSPISIPVNINQKHCILAIRLAPSVDNGRVGLLGVRELVNRMQVQLRAMDTITTGQFRIEVVLNGRTSSALTFNNIGGSSLAQVALGAANNLVTGGETIYSFFTNSGVQQNQQGPSQPNYSQYAYTSQDLSFVRELGNSVLGGGLTNFTPTVGNASMYPDGPDILYITATNVDLAATRNISSRVSWVESQA